MSKRRARRPPADLTTLLDPSFYRALCEPTRLSILAWLAQQRAPRNVSEVAESGTAGRDLSVVSRHLAQLRDAGIVEATRAGKQVLYRINAEALVRTLRTMADAIEACCGVPRERKRS